MEKLEVRYNTYSKYLRGLFGTRVHKIPVNAGFTCPNRDGTVAKGGCTYCNIDGFTPEAARARVPIREQVEMGIAFMKKRNGAESFIVYFQPYSNTYAPLRELIPFYEEALAHPEVIGLSVGTRPDCVDDEKLAYFAQLSRNYFVTLEYGIESIHDKTLAAINRGHDYQCTLNAIEKTAGLGLRVCGHIILGFPNETASEMMQTVDEVAKLPLTFIKIHNLHVVRHTQLAKQYEDRPFHVFTLDEWVQLACDVLERLSPNIIVERLYGDAPRRLLIEPQWCRDGAIIIRAIQQELVRRDSCQGKRFEKVAADQLSQNPSMQPNG